ncbi:hypothetical protein COHA_007849 [Chlorella ohadii]|uniref:peptidylprolyl isomerase n=1 Tax=Chlorella ohadii TaxID=2649997 RepID=A0AAD5DIN1_9CHLO|nr:hypothetical protein COHA_007849 [Chlorella ohadii]
MLSAAPNGSLLAAAAKPAAPPARRSSQRHVCRASSADRCSDTLQRRQALAALVAVTAAAIGSGATQPAAAASDFVQTASGLLIQDITVGQGAQPKPGDKVVVHWAGRTKNYQAKRIDNTSLRDEPFEFFLGANTVIPAFEEAVAGMRVGGVRRIEVLGEIPELSYPRDRSQRFNGSKYRYGPQPADFDGQRALDFVLDNNTLSDTNRTLLFDIKLLAVRPQ